MHINPIALRKAFRLEPIHVGYQHYKSGSVIHINKRYVNFKNLTCHLGILLNCGTCGVTHEMPFSRQHRLHQARFCDLRLYIAQYQQFSSNTSVRFHSDSYP